MRDEAKADSTAARPGEPHLHGPLPRIAPGSQSVSRSGMTHRVDASHYPADTESVDVVDESELLQADDDAIDRPSADGEYAATSAPRREADMLLQAHQIADHSRAQLVELDRRTQRLTEQLAQLDQERRNFRMWVHESEEELRDRQLQLGAIETEATDRIRACEKIASELQEREQELCDIRDQLESDRASLKEDVSRDLAAEQNALRRNQEALQAERERLNAQVEAHVAEHQAMQAQIRTQIDRERAGLRQFVEGELRAEREEIAREKQVWADQYVAQMEEVAHERAITEAAYRRTENELLQLREAQNQSFESWKAEQLATFAPQRAAHEARMRSEREAFELELTRRQKEWIAVLEAEQTQIECDREITEAASQRTRAELDALRRNHDEQLRREREEHDRRLSDERNEFESGRDQQLAQIQQERALLENRVRFQQDHLEKKRAEIEAAQNEVRVERQQARAQQQQRTEQQRLRAIQLEQYRTMLDELERSLSRERNILLEGRQNLDQDIARQRERFDRERQAMQQERDAKLAEVARQQNMLAMHAENLEGRHVRLEQLRVELEATHRDTLEMRMAVEEARAQLAQSAGVQPAAELFDAAREAVAAHHRQLQNAMEKQRQELSEAETLLGSQKDEFRAERERMAEWIAQRDEMLRLGEQRLAEATAEFAARESAGREVGDQWTREKLQAEAIIRELLGQVAHLTAQPVAEPGTRNTAQ